MKNPLEALTLNPEGAKRHIIRSSGDGIESANSVPVGASLNWDCLPQASWPSRWPRLPRPYLDLEVHA